MSEKIIIAAVSKNGVIGKNGKIPWFSETELTHFKNLTMGFPIIMGRKTYESIGKVLPGRLNIVLTRKDELKSKNGNVKSFNNLEDAVYFCEMEKFEKLFIIGGGEIYQEAMNIVDRIILSEMDLFADGDVYFPGISKDWQLESKVKKEGFTIKNYTRVNE